MEIFLKDCEKSQNCTATH